MEKILSIIGPTAVGKTSIAIEIAKQINGEIIGLDSRQIYYGMTIGTAQPTQKEQAGIRHHLIGIRSPDEIITAGEYIKLVKAVIVDIIQRGRTPIICGGAGLYYRALKKGIFEGSTSDPKVRTDLEKQYDLDPQVLLDKLNTIDPDYAEIVHINNKKRLVRALEIFELTGVTPTAHFKNQAQNPQANLDLFTVLLSIHKNLLFEKICRRTNQMIADGMIGEVKELIKIYDHKTIHPLDSIGYSQVIKYINNKITYDEMIEEVNIRTRQYAKKQMTWFKNEAIDMTVEFDNYSLLKDLVKKIILNYMTVT